MSTPGTWKPQDPNFESVVRASFARQQLLATLGAELRRVDPGEVHIRAPFSEAFTQQNGFWHAGAVASLADSANGYAAYTLAAAGTDVLAVEFKINLLAPARGDSFLAEASVVRAGRTLTVCRAEVYGFTGELRTHVATMLSTLIVR
jgi:uncharacterized protein (TIGR00369 family)